MEEDFREKVCEYFKLDSLHSHQTKAIEGILKMRDVFIATRTGGGKSLCYQGLFAVRPDAKVLVITPLLAIMKEQTTYLNNRGISSEYISCNKESDMRIRNGDVSCIFSSPELVLGDSRWRELWKRFPLDAIVIDEAHVIVEWGESHGGCEPFREWFGKIGELRSLQACPVMVLTATASQLTRKKLKLSLCMSKNTIEVIDSPDRPNITLHTACHISSSEIATVFDWLLDEMMSHQQEMSRYIVFCKSIKDCTKVYLTFVEHFGKQNPMFNMYHSKTVPVVKDIIEGDMNNEKGAIKVLICTKAAGMGVNFKGVNNVVHYGVPETMDSFVQQIGRAGRSGAESDHILLYNKRQLVKCDPEIKQYTEEDCCLRNALNKMYTNENIVKQPKHRCCMLCARTCDCNNCSSPHKYFLNRECEFETNDSTLVSQEETAWDSSASE